MPDVVHLFSKCCARGLLLAQTAARSYSPRLPVAVHSLHGGQPGDEWWGICGVSPADVQDHPVVVLPDSRRIATVQEWTTYKNVGIQP